MHSGRKGEVWIGPVEGEKGEGAKMDGRGETDRPTDRQSDRQTDKHTDGQKNAVSQVLNQRPHKRHHVRMMTWYKRRDRGRKTDCFETEREGERESWRGRSREM